MTTPPPKPPSKSTPKSLPTVGTRASERADRGASASRAELAPEPAVVQTAWARLLMTSLYRAGTREAVISPGSRSTPLVLAAEHAGLRTRTIIDERAAAFFALGHARVTGTPVALICTSGTAGAHYFPAIIEAAQSFIPMIVLTADRPPELVDCAAPQTIDQTRLYGRYARWFADLGPAQADARSLRGVARKAAQAFAASLGPIPGPVHINVPARKPLEPAQARSAADLAVVERADHITRTIHTRASRSPSRASDEIIESLARACTGTKRGLIVSGPLSPARWLAGNRAGPGQAALVGAASDLAKDTGFPLLCEATSQLRFAPGSRECSVDAFDLLLADPRLRQAARPDLILQLGGPPTSMSWGRFVAENPDCITCVIAEHGWNDPHGAADLLVMADPVDAIIRLAQEVAGRNSPSGSPWAPGWMAANEIAWSCIDEAFDRGALIDRQTMREGQATRATVSALPRGTRLLVGNGLPIRSVDIYCRAGSNALTVLYQRGANGIDGLLAAAAGAAASTSSSRRPWPTAALIGDVSFMHDVASLAICARAEAPLVLIVIDNRGGRIFELLPIASSGYGSSDQLFARHWLTAPEHDIQGLCDAFGAGYAHAVSPDQVSAAVTKAARTAGCTVVHAVVDPSSAAVDRQAAIAALARRLAKTVDRRPDHIMAKFLADAEKPK